jgi:hypothetical protein
MYLSSHTLVLENPKAADLTTLLFRNNCGEDGRLSIVRPVAVEVQIEPQQAVEPNFVASAQ